MHKINTQSSEFASSTLRKNTLKSIIYWRIVEMLTDRRTNKGSWMAEFYNDIDQDQTKKCSFAFAPFFLLLKIGEYSVKVRRLFIQRQQLRVLKSHCSWKWPPFSLIGERDTFCLIHGELFGWYQWKEERCCSLGIDEKLSPKGSKPKLFGTLIILRYAINFFYPIFDNFCQFLQFFTIYSIFGEKITNIRYDPT